MIYLATPYTHPDRAVRQARFERACAIAGYLMKKDRLPIFSPVAHGHPISEQCGLPAEWGFWEAYCKALLSRATWLLVVRMEGWEQSEGVQAEIAYAELCRIPIKYMDVPEGCCGRAKARLNGPRQRGAASVPK